MSDPLQNIRVILVEPATPGNVGATARALKNTGISKLSLVNPGIWDTKEARWMAHGSGDILDACEVHPNLESALASAHVVVGTTQRLGRSRVVDSRPHLLIPRLAQAAHHHQIALVFGREKDGLWLSELRQCHHLLRFPTAVINPSLNLSQAVLLCTYQFYCALGKTEIPEETFPQPLIDSKQRQQLYFHISSTMARIGLRPYNDITDHFERAVRRFLDRIPLRRSDALLIHKICGQIKKFAVRNSVEASHRDRSG